MCSKSSANSNEFYFSNHKGTHLTFDERKIIERLLRKHTPKKQIARILDRSINTIRNEIKRGSVEQITKCSQNKKKGSGKEKIYFAEAGQNKYKTNRKNCGRKSKLSECIDLIKYIENNIKNKTSSVDASIGYAKRFNLFNNYVCTQTVYNYIDFNLVNIKNIDLPKKIRIKPKNKRIRRNKRIYGRSIEERPEAVNKRLEFGHWEADGIVGRNHKGHLITIVERKTGYGLIFNVHDRKKDRIISVIDYLQGIYGKYFPTVFKTITFDNGTEFADCKSIEKNGRTIVFYAHPYSSFERGTNENWNGIVRRYIPKESSFSNLNNEVIKRINNKINNLPRKRFNYKTPKELYSAELNNIMAA